MGPHAVGSIALLTLIGASCAPLACLAVGVWLPGWQASIWARWALLTVAAGWAVVLVVAATASGYVTALTVLLNGAHP